MTARWGFSLGPPSAIIETEDVFEPIDGMTSFSLGPPSAIIETCRGRLDLTLASVSV